MKKHPIDDLFAKKLAEHRQEPSQKAFEKFQVRLAEKQDKRRGGFFLANLNWGYYAAAAGIVVALAIGILSQQNTSNETILASADMPKKVDNKPYNINKNTDSQLVASENNTKKLIETNVEQSEKKASKHTLKSPIISLETNVAKLENQPKVLENLIDDDSPEEPNAVAINTIFEKTIIEKIEPKGIQTTDVSKNITDESIVLILEPEQIEREMIPAINQDSETSLAEVKRLGAEKEENAKSFIAKLYGEYKHFKYGEKVDFKKIGVKDALVRVDESLFKEEREDVRDFVQRRVGRLQKRD
ncbi:hypothetical protein [Emticicia sp.]|uniref:hypothetical protein n=1 Tax=Emticicia sp. TaxID=1930953 RepID=UPI0037511D41